MAKGEKHGILTLRLFQMGRSSFEGVNGPPSDFIPTSGLRRHQVQFSRRFCLISTSSGNANGVARDSRDEFPVRHGQDTASRHLTISTEQTAGPSYLSGGDIELRICQMAIDRAKVHQPHLGRAFFAAGRSRRMGDRFSTARGRIAGGDRPLLKNRFH
jgi:hypothetical protein